MEAAACGPAALQFPPPHVRSNRNEGKQRNDLPSPRRSNLHLVTVGDSRGKHGFLRQRKPPVGQLQSLECSQVPALEAGYLRASSNGNWLLKTKAQEVSLCLDGRSIFLVGMMGSGKTTVGKILSEALGYTFVDSDKYVEQAIGQDSVTQIFKQRGECIFRDFESDALRKLSFTPQQVVATGGGAVVRPINWKYIRQGVSVFLDVPLDALARRIAAVGTDSRPLLHFESGDPYTQAFIGLFTLSKKRAESYASADVTVSILDLAANLGVEDVLDVTPTAIAIEVLVQMEKFLQGNNMSRRMFP
ncbi:shikimate kinase 3, chloroplastic-like isoform X2 [Syzygium oleosum]|uniref:shikimate kinase 3, chloroplastic-like isoform X2 n=1 Tax=Syzygium oleosum TaxID=219896 RepID=UPI0011D1D8B7|nr:shikimate kinase 3, chloroplastic-like isoform X2 [Syzygium oleosum]